MPKKITCDDILHDESMPGRDLMLIEMVESRRPANAVRGPLKRVFEGEGGKTLEFEFDWTAFQVLDAGGSWHVSHQETTIGFSKELVSLTLQDDGRIDFEVPEFASGSICVPGDNLKSSQVKGLSHSKSPLN